MNKKLCSFLLMGMLVSSSFTSLPVFADNSPWSVSLTIGPASISYSEGNHQLRNDFFRLD